ncbi:putative polygalacturonase [Glycine max]|nr:putative polygalacturonase [Glycine max]
MLLLPVLSLSPSFPSLTSNRYLQFRPRRSCRVVRWAATKSGDDEFTAKSGYLFELSATKADSLGNTRYQKSQPYARGSLCSWLATWCKPASHSGSGSVSATSILSWTAPGQCFRLHNALALGMNYVFAESWAPQYGNTVLSKWPIKRWKLQKIFDHHDYRVANGLDCFEYPAISCRKHSAVLTDFGGVGDGKTSNTKAFQYAISNLSHYAFDGGALLVVPPGKWLT